MGTISAWKTHGKRSSSMSLFIRGLLGGAARIRLIVAMSVAVVIVFLLMLYGTTLKRVSIVVDGEPVTVITRHAQPERLLEDQGIQIGLYDRVQWPDQGRLKDGDSIVIERTTPIVVQADGRQRIMHTLGGTVAEAIDDLRLQVGEFDRIEPDAYNRLLAGDVIRIVRVTKVLGEQHKELPFTVVKKNDAGLAQGREKVVAEGRLGTLLETLEYTYEDGMLAAARVLETTVAEASVDKVIAVGTKKPVAILSASSPSIQQVTKDGISFGVKQILSDAVLTAYHAGVESTGKSEGHPQYGITFSGTKVSEGRTVAVDPKVIPIGWWVYIEGYGFRRAEDKGSAVKGKMIDIYYEDGDKARKFGKKKGATVYIIGPTKPE